MKTKRAAVDPAHDHEWAVNNLNTLARREIRRIKLELVKFGGTGMTPATTAIGTWEHVIRICEEAGVTRPGILR